MAFPNQLPEGFGGTISRNFGINPVVIYFFRASDVGISRVKLGKSFSAEGEDVGVMAAGISCALGNLGEE